MDSEFNFVRHGTWWTLPWYKKLMRWLRYVPIGYVIAYSYNIPHTIAYILHSCGLPLKQAIGLGLKSETDNTGNFKSSGVFRPQFLISLAISHIDTQLDRMYVLDIKD